MLKLIFPHGGWGLGNDLVPWCKAYILQKRLGNKATILGPAWGNNPRGYYKYFRTSRFDHQYCKAILKLVPGIPFTEELFRESNCSTFSEACDFFIERTGLRGRSAYAVTITGLWGAFPGIREARSFVVSTLMSTRYTPDNLHVISSKTIPTKLSVGLHIRLGDFTDAVGSLSDSQEGRCNVRLPGEWYLSICNELERKLGRKHLQYFVCSDGSREEIAPIFAGKDYIFCSELNHSDISDLMWLSKSDLLICSASTYSVWAAFLSDAPYIWYRKDLSDTTSASSVEQLETLGVQMPDLEVHGGKGRGVLVDRTGVIPDSLTERLRLRLREKELPYEAIFGRT